MGYMWYELVRMVTSRAWSSGWPFLVRRNQPFLVSSHWSRAQHENFGANRALHSLPADSEPSCAHTRCGKMSRTSHQDRPAQPLIPRLVSGLTDQLDPQVDKDIKDHQRSCSNIKYLQIFENIVADNTNIYIYIYTKTLKYGSNLARDIPSFQTSDFLLGSFFKGFRWLHSPYAPWCWNM